MLVDIGDTYKDLDTNGQFIDVIEDKISWEFADIIRQKLLGQDERFEKLQLGYEGTEADNYYMQDALQEISWIAQNAISKIKDMKQLNPKVIIEILESIKQEAENSL